ncbi:MAG: DUF373 family protein [Candidatus Syntropharchaeia archaeon]
MDLYVIKYYPMKTLIICVDRDDDIGRKTGIKTPIIGREENLAVATRLGITDPEESDVNCLFGGIKVYDEMKSLGEEVEIVCISGDEEVGITSDRKLADQLDEVLEKTGAESGIVISDGAEDEVILPIIQSRIKIDSVKRIVVKQNQNIENTYYYLKQVFENPKITRTFFVPIGLACIVYAICWIVGYPEGAVISILGFIGIYLLSRGLGFENILYDFAIGLKESFYGGRITFITYVAAIILGIVATVVGFAEAWEYSTQPVFPGYLNLAVKFINASVWWYTGAFILSGVGKMINAYLEKGWIRRHFVFPFLTIASALLFWGGSTYILSFREGEYKSGILILVLSILGAFIISFIGIQISTYIGGEEGECDLL